LLRSSSLRKQPRIIQHRNPPSLKIQALSTETSMSRGVLTTTVLTTAAHAEFTLRSAMPPQQGDAYYECAVTRVTPADRDRNPGYKVDLHIDREDGRVVAFGVVHTLADGTTVDRSAQYKGDRINWWPNGSAQWTGWHGNMLYDRYLQRQQHHLYRSDPCWRPQRSRECHDPDSRPLISKKAIIRRADLEPCLNLAPRGCKAELHS
jgi:hypothetical protein